MNLFAPGLFVFMSLMLHRKAVNLPDPLTSATGQKVTSVQQWRDVQRPEILELFRKHVYGRAPVGRPDSLKFATTVTPYMMDGTATRKQVVISYGTERGQGAIKLTLFIPSKAKQPSPCMLLICNRGARNIDPERATKSEFWPAEQLVARGYAAAAFQVADVLPDRKDNLDQGVHAIFDAPGTRAADAWGTISAWAWGASRIMDYLETDPDIDKKRVIVVGHSRGGKTALWAAAQDERFAMAVSNDSGSTGAALARGKQGEHIKEINTTFPHWFNENYKTYNDREADLPVDQHMLLGLMAPRPVYVASATQDATADPEAEFASAVAASSVYELFGLKGLVATVMPKPEVPLQEGSIGYHLRDGEHDLLTSDWNHFMDFADKRLVTLIGIWH